MTSHETAQIEHNRVGIPSSAVYSENHMHHKHKIKISIAAIVIFTIFGGILLSLTQTSRSPVFSEPTISSLPICLTSSNYNIGTVPDAAHTLITNVHVVVPSTQYPLIKKSLFSQTIKQSGELSHFRHHILNSNGLFLYGLIT